MLCLGDRHETSLENIQVYFSQLTRAYQEALEEGLQQGLEPIRAQVSRRLGTVEPELRSQIQQLSSVQVEELGEALWDFSTTEDLIAWLQTLG